MDFPHSYHARAEAHDGDVVLSSGTLPEIRSAPPAAFGGPGDRWSPEDLLVASVADCFALSFQAVARASRLAWDRLEVDVEGTLDRIGNEMRFTKIVVRPTLHVGADVPEQQPGKVLEKAERMCLITNSLSSEVTLEPTIVTG